MVHFSLLYKGQASEELDVILVRGGQPAYEQRRPGAIKELFQGDLLGLFLVSRPDPAVAYELAIENDVWGMMAVERAIAGEITLRPSNDYGVSGMRRKYFYGVSSKQLIGKRDFWPFGLDQVTTRDDLTILWGRFPSPTLSSSTQTSLAVVPDGEGFRQIESPFGPSVYREGETELATFGDGCSLVETREDLLLRSILCDSGSGAHVRYEAPHTDFDRFAAARPVKVSSGWTREQATFNETIGPYQLEGDTLWFGLTFYDGEGFTGLGGFGLFNSVTRQFEINYPPEVASWPVSALLVEEDAAWLGLEGRGEGHAYSGGLVRWDRATHEIQHWPEAPLTLGIVHQGERYYLATGEGAAVFENGAFVPHVLDVDEAGAYRLAKPELR